MLHRFEIHFAMELLRTALLCCRVAALHLREACWQSSGFIDIEMQWMLQQLISRVYCIHSYSRIQSIEHTLNSSFSLTWSVALQIWWKKSFYEKSSISPGLFLYINMAGIPAFCTTIWLLWYYVKTIYTFPLIINIGWDFCETRIIPRPWLYKCIHMPI